MTIRFTCGERKTWQNIDKSQNIMTKIVANHSSKYTMLIHFRISTHDLQDQGYLVIALDTFSI